MAVVLTRDEILRNTLFHIQLKRCQYIDNFPEAVARIFETSFKRKRLMKYDDIKNRLYRIKTSFFKINGDKIKKRDFFLGLYNRISDRAN